jgi:hypothetical protein
LELAEEEPDAIQFAEALEMPEDAELTDVASGYWNAWHFLSSDRPLGAMGGAGRIPGSLIENYAEKNQFEDAELLARMMWAMDDVYLEWLAEKQKTPNAN